MVDRSPAPRRIGRADWPSVGEGYRLTDLGEHLLPYAERAEAAIVAFERQSLASDKDLTGTVRVTCASTLADRLASSALIDTFHARYPCLRVEPVITDRLLDLGRSSQDHFRSGAIATARTPDGVSPKRRRKTRLK
jgi:DNA-binding transcriptional LysR family regulator